jgi:hypothetical protein
MVMSVRGQSRQFGQVPTTSGLPRSTDIRQTARHVGSVQKRALKAYWVGITAESFFASKAIRRWSASKRRAAGGHQ